ncbi:MAG: hypothetical protein D6771_05330 [Zetaproteobacteria bacterium]|nr:MAG: hypothetical protein D6771_05330 [Zetaproteobacteria bacterium]
MPLDRNALAPIVIGVVAPPSTPEHTSEMLKERLAGALEKWKHKWRHSPFLILRPQSLRDLDLNDDRVETIAVHKACFARSKNPEACVLAYIARHAHILVAVGENDPFVQAAVSEFETGDPGASAAASDYMQAAEDHPSIPDYPTLRRHAGISKEKLGLVWRMPISEGEQNEPIPPEESLPAYLNSIERFNEEATTAEDIENTREQAKKWFPLGSDPAKNPNAFGVARLREAFATADGVAQNFRDIALGHFRLVAALVFLAVVAIKVADHLEAYRLWGGAAFAALFAVLLGIQYDFHRRKDHHRHLEYRMLAEGLRVQIAWIVAGLQDPVCDHQPIKQLRKSEWVWHALRGLHAQAMAGGCPSLMTPDTLKEVREQWIDDQKNYLERKIEGKKRKHAWSIKIDSIRSKLAIAERVRLASLVLGGAFLAAGHILDAPVPVVHEKIVSALPLLPHESVFAVFSFLGVALLAVAFLADKAMQALALREELEWYQAMRDAYESASKALENIAPSHAPASGLAPAQRLFAERLLLRLGALALEETSVWADLHKRVDLFKIRPEA